ncbi:methylmalonyl-CoA mutase [Haloferax mediterranei ATCC 33500]|uniref:Methylmalonyl-CoA mutase n=1 Tax=Haloferax mediterranei (strain ATCC 33500 / DSM 1411 / JCM 8866 / NBRC 14739 / NCIMB 2177 / R-4) TaxID=523841 RepID=I3R4K4_HALMT|nr:methylmalonyl-CoA mutase family protein [Haloferax mediterranei]AFK19164.1 methylmalonyl-CoA mutase, N-terminal domain protein [Haloferax mediterranei ATCC 33500]AHZ21473.1 methylmalonyl-CoA mutase [Haloferax mediterranei ATCC 33500]EMA03933.1 methylmalonyl-CoA mutase, N-terminal domain protein [Haloferax mediterranei ATCC 33500]MDX5989263.1 methylmalonyl-CoA mutase family protein [Haloferax mediterranei ATCC 33500]QCQ75634.1 methylmalonyl-CoA mutase [Haloferax mediterranei ATCC 33500]
MFDPDELEEIREAKAEWEEETLSPTLDRFGERKDEFTTDTGGNVVERLYTPADTDLDYDEDIGFPGEKPYTRGVYPTMHRGRLWTMRQYAGFGTAAETNERFRYLIDNGSSGLSLAFDLPTQMGYDSDAMMAAGEVGKSGVAIDSLHDMETVFDGIDLGEVSTSMTINAPAAVLLAMYVALGDKQGVPREQLRGTIQNDIMKEYIARNLYIFPPEPSMRLITDIFEFCAEETPKFNTISISGYHIREAGSTAAQEVAFTLGNGIQYVQAAVDAGLDVDDFAPQLSFFFNAHNNILEEVSKFRAARRMWAKIMEERFGAENPKSMQLKFHTQTGGSTLTAQQVENNVVRVAYQALAAVLGGTQSLHTNGKDEALSLPTEKSVRTALRTQQILAHESGAADTIDPLAGSYYVEALTDDIEDEAFDLLDEVDERGGMLKAVKNQWVQGEIQDVAYERQREIETGERTIVGVNKYQVDEEPTVEVQEVSEKEEQKQVEALEARKEARDDEAVDAALEAIRTAANSDDNLMPFIVDAVKAYATIGEICGVLREEFGEYEPGMA